MPCVDWQPGLTLEAPVYIDSNVLVSSFIAKDSRYQITTQAFADLLANQSQIQISALTVSESLWGLTKQSYHQLYNHKSNAKFDQNIYKNQAEKIFAKFGSRIKLSVQQWLRDWTAAGVDVSLVPIDRIDEISAIAPTYMDAYHLASSDAFHLATAELSAGSLLTSDNDFRQAQASPLQICLLR